MATGFKTWQCENCGFLYEEEFGLPAEGIAPGTRWEDVADDFICPNCGFAKSQFSMIEV
ncbi:MAG: rubredoxin [Alphaproteobacteria bacterium]|nr:rubredoxin [Alphaproteobacteria bacterium]MBL6937397.1 rubredoxin [Alphaproteobacteria bacterium]MBL7096041.1 rubredoxin [Alphaproteobacteria bacterium]